MTGPMAEKYSPLDVEAKWGDFWELEGHMSANAEARPPMPASPAPAAAAFERGGSWSHTVGSDPAFWYRVSRKTLAADR